MAYSCRALCSTCRIRLGVVMLLVCILIHALGSLEARDSMQTTPEGPCMCGWRTETSTVVVLCNTPLPCQSTWWSSWWCYCYWQWIWILNLLVYTSTLFIIFHPVFKKSLSFPLMLLLNHGKDMAMYLLSCDRRGEGVPIRYHANSCGCQFSHNFYIIY